MTARLTIDIRPVEIDGKHYVSMSMNGREMERRGPFSGADAAEAMADRLIRRWLTNPPPWMQAAPGVWSSDALVALGRSLRNKLLQNPTNANPASMASTPAKRQAVPPWAQT